MAKGPENWSTRAGVITSVEDFQSKKGEPALRGVVKNDEGKESTVEAYSAKAIEKLRAAFEAGKPVVVRGDAYFTKENVAVVMVSHIAEKGAPKAAKEDKPELTEEEKAAKAAERAEAGKARAAEADKTRVPVLAGSVAEGADIEVGGSTMKVESLGSAWKLEKQEDVDKLKARFPDVELNVGDEVQFAKYASPEADNSPAP